MGRWANFIDWLQDGLAMARGEETGYTHTSSSETHEILMVMCRTCGKCITSSDEAELESRMYDHVTSHVLEETKAVKGVH